MKTIRCDMLLRLGVLFQGVFCLGVVCSCSVGALSSGLRAEEQTGAEAASQPEGETKPRAEDFDLQPSSEDLEYWSFRPMGEINPEAFFSANAWVRTPVDAFILRKLTDKGLTPSPPAEPQVWLRRVYLDAIGLPPTREQVEAFLKETGFEARQRVVDQLLNDPGYGIRWGRKWLDVVRYADTNGYERDGDKPHVWRYRDYVINSLNQDKPFDQFLTEQLAGDEVEHPTAETMIATAYLRLGAWDDEPADPTIDRYDQLDDIIKSLSANFMGLTLNCARCHNHKFEPLSQMDYAGLQAFFDPLERPQNGRTDLDMPVGTREEFATFSAAQGRYESALKGVQDQLNPLLEAVRRRHLEGSGSKLPAEAITALKVEPGQRNEEQKKLVETHKGAWEEELRQVRTPLEQQQISAFETAISGIKQAAPAPLPRAYIWKEHDLSKIPATYVFKRGNPATPAVAAQPRVPRVLDRIPLTMLAPDADRKTTLRRLSLANWLTNPEHPLTARVIANRIWQGHFGEGIVRTENDFGLMGSAPTHPELLDWLARYLIEQKWSLKQLHRAILLSNTYAQSSLHRPEVGDKDMSDELLSRYPARRLDAEQIRDTMLLANGRLNPAMGGTGVYPKIPDAVLAGQSIPGNGWGKSTDAEASRRSVYIHVKRSLIVPMFELLDLPDSTTPCEQRNVSTIPTQALTLLNSEFLNEEADHLAERLEKEAGSDIRGEIERGYWLALSRAPSEEEVNLAVEFLEKQAKKLREEFAAAPLSSAGEGEAVPGREEVELKIRRRALQAFGLVLLNLNEFFYVD